MLIRFGVSYVSAEQACRNAEEEIPRMDFDGVVAHSKKLWNKKCVRENGRVGRRARPAADHASSRSVRLNRVQVSNTTDKTITQLVYSSFYRQFLSPNNATLETQGKFAGTSSPYFDGLYCTWDTFRTFFPLLSLTSPQDYADIVETYIDGWRKLGQIPECRANNVPGLTQGE